MSQQYGLETEVELRKGNNCLFRIHAPKPDPDGHSQCIAVFHLYWLVNERRFYLQDKRYASHLPLRKRMIEFLKSIGD